MIESSAFIHSLCGCHLNKIHMFGSILVLSFLNSQQESTEMDVHISVYFTVQRNNTMIIDSSRFFKTYDEIEVQMFKERLKAHDCCDCAVTSFKLMSTNNCEISFDNGLRIASCTTGIALSDDYELWRIFTPARLLNNSLIAYPDRLEIYKPDREEMIFLDNEMKKWCIKHPESKLSELSRRYRLMYPQYLEGHE